MWGHLLLDDINDSYLFIVVLNLRNTLNLDYSTLARGESLQARARRHRLGQKVDVHLIHSSKVLHIGQVYIVFDNLFKRRSRELKHLLEVLENGPLCTSELVAVST